VIDERNGADLVTRYARSACTNPADHIRSLRKREGDPPATRIGFVDLVNNTERDWPRREHPTACDRIKEWAQAQSWDGVVWTGLTGNFTES